jgi:hypothetical protein
MDWDGYKLTKDERAVLDHVTGLCSVLPVPQGEPCKDREIVGELVAMRSKLSTLAITPPRMRLSFDDILRAAEQVPAVRPSSRLAVPPEGKIFYHLSSRWGLGLMAAASVAVAVITGMFATGWKSANPAVAGEADLVMPGSLHNSPLGGAKAEVSQFPIRTAPQAEPPIQIDSPLSANDINGSLVRTGSLRLQAKNPADINAEVTALVTLMGGFVTRLTRQGTGDDTTIDIEVAVPSDRFAEFTKKTASLADVVSQTESAEDVSSQQIDLSARLSEAEAYLKRLDSLPDKPSNLAELQDFERRRREVSLEIERYRKAQSSLSNRVSYARLNLHIAATAPETQADQSKLSEALDDGLTGLESTSAFLVKTGIAGSPVLGLGALIYLALRRKRRKQSA